MKLTKLQAWGAALAVLLIPLVALAGVAYKNLEPETALRRVCYRLLAPATSGALGVGGVIGLQSYGTGASVSMVLGTGSQAVLRTPPYPSRIAIGLVDASANDTLTCSNITVEGYDQFGRFWSESGLAATETIGVKTSRAYSQVTRITGTCVAGTDAGDGMVVGVSLEAALPARTRVLSDIETACIVDASDSSAVKCAALNDGSTDDLESDASLFYDVLDASAAIFGAAGSEVAAAAGDDLCIAVRSSWNYR